MAISKIELDNSVLIDLTQDTATAEDVAQGKYFHLANGVRTVGTASPPAPSLQNKTVTYSSNGTGTVSADSGYDGLNTVTVNISLPYYDGGVS